MGIASDIAEPRGDLALRTLAMPADSNPRGDIFGGWIMALMDSAGWREKDGGEDFHARFVLTDRGGVGVDAGLSAEGNHQTTIMHLMSCGLAQERALALERTATVYERVGPILRISADGSVRRV